MATYYVNSSVGNNANDGLTPYTAWKTLASATSRTLQPNDKVLLQAGSSFNETLTPTRSGTAGRPIVWGTYGSGKANVKGGIYLNSVSFNTFAQLLIDGPNTGVVGSGSGTGSTHISFDRCEIRNTASIGINSANHSDANWTITNSCIHDTGDSGIVLQGPDALVAFCSIARTGLVDVGYGEHGIYSKSARARLVANDISAFRHEGISTRFRDTVIEYNAIHDGPRAIAYYNYDLTGSGTTVVRFNRCWNVQYGLLVDHGDERGGVGMYENWRVYNNTILCRWEAVDIRPNGSTETIIKNNAAVASELIANNDLNLPHTTTYAADHNLLGASATALGLSAPPTLAPTSAGSPVVNAGTTNVPGVTLSYQGSAPEIGAVEFEQ